MNTFVVDPNVKFPLVVVVVVVVGAVGVVTGGLPSCGVFVGDGVVCVVGFGGKTVTVTVLLLRGNEVAAVVAPAGGTPFVVMGFGSVLPGGEGVTRPGVAIFFLTTVDQSTLTIE